MFDCGEWGVVVGLEVVLSSKFFNGGLIMENDVSQDEMFLQRRRSAIRELKALRSACCSDVLLERCCNEAIDSLRDIVDVGVDVGVGVD